MQRGMEWLKKSKLTSSSAYTSNKSNYSDDEYKQLQQGGDTAVPVPPSHITKRHLEHQLKLHHDLVREISSDTTSTAVSCNSARNKCCLKCSLEFSLLKPKRTCMNW